MNYPETLEFLYNALPEFQQVGAEAYKPGLERVRAFLRHLGDPHNAFKSIHIAGTNGKGSVSHIIASVLMAAGYRVGLYTSPHLRDFRERIRIDGQMISEDEVVEFVERHRGAMEGLSFFEMTVGMAFDRFRAAGVDVAVVEVGLGGRLDATNVVTPVLSVITNIGLDHTALLGDTIARIAFEKAGIIKRGVPVVVGEHGDDIDAVFVARAREECAPLVFAQDAYRCVAAREEADFQVLEVERPEGAAASAECAGGAATGAESGPARVEAKRLAGRSAQSVEAEDGRFSVTLDLLGDYQRNNIVTCMAVFAELNERTPLKVDYRAIERGCAVAAQSTGLVGRWQKLGERPLVIADTGHNEHGLREVVAQIARQSYRKLYMVVGFAADKDIDAILSLLPRGAWYVFTQASSRRALPAEQLAQRARAVGLEGEVAPTVAEALARARAIAAAEDMIFVGGSNFVVAEVV